MAQVELTRPPAIDSGGRNGDGAVQVERRPVVSGLAGDRRVEGHVVGLTVSPRDMDRRWGVALVVDPRDHEVPFVGVSEVALGIRESVLFHRNLHRGGRRGRRYVLGSNVAARRTRRAEEHEYEADQAEHAGDE